MDGNNVMGSRPDGWWRDRRAAARRLVDGLTAFAAATGVPVTVVFDGSAPGGESDGRREDPERGVTVRYAQRSGPDAADDVIVDLVAGAPADLVVVTADRRLRERVAAAGVDVTGPRAFLAALDELGTA